MMQTSNNEPVVNESPKAIKPEIVIQNDYDGYFERWAKQLANALEIQGNTKFTTINVNSGPYRNSGLTYGTKEGVIYLDFYSAVRTGFGSIGVTPEDLATELLTGKAKREPIPGATAEQSDKVWDLLDDGYIWNRDKSAAAAGVILEKGEDFWFFGLDGEIMHNPDGITIKV